MKFCNNCGKQLQDDEVCTCQAQNTEAAASEAQAEQTAQPASKPIITKEQATEISLGLLKYAQDFVKDPFGAVDEVVENGTVVTVGGLAVVNAALSIIVALVNQLMNLFRGWGFSFNTLLTRAFQDIVWWIVLPLGFAGSIMLVTKVVQKSEIDFKKALNIFAVPATIIPLATVVRLLNVILNYNLLIITGTLSTIVSTVMYILTVRALVKIWGNEDKKLFLSIPALCALLYLVQYLFGVIF